MEITATLIKQLREQTHAGIMDCKKALQASNGDFDEAEKYLKKVGLAAVAKREGRVTEFGGIFIARNDKAIAMVEITCETDFVAKNESFKAMGNDVARTVVEKGYTEVVPELVEKVNALIATINENMLIKNIYLQQIADDEYVVSYIHGDGLIGVVVTIKAADKAAYQNEAFQKLAFNTALHVCASDPMFLDVKDIPEAYTAEQTEIFNAQVASLDKPENVKAGIVRGKLTKLYSEITLLKQEFAIENDDHVSVEALFAKVGKENGFKATVTKYVRFKAGATN